MSQYLNQLSKLSSSYGVICHDAGGANQIIALHQKYGYEPSRIFVDGPGKVLWDSNFPGESRYSLDLSWIEQASLIVTGTGWESDVEHKARKIAQEFKVPSVAILDHWTNFRERFIRNGEEVLPNEFWVVDDYAEQKIKEFFPSGAVFRIPDYYAERELAKLNPINEDTPDVLLYLAEPMRSDWGKREPGEFQALRYFLDRLPFIGLPPNTKICLRLHPSENPDKYDRFLHSSEDFPIHKALGSLSENLSDCRWVAGCQTYAMTLALRSGRQVFGSLPPWAPPCALPHQGIIHIKNLIAE